MSILFNDNINTSAPFPIDNRYGQTTGGGAASSNPFTPYISAAAAHGSIDNSKKFIGLSVLVGTVPNISEYWYVDDPTNVANLVPKGISTGAADNGLSVSSNKIKLGGSDLSANTSVELLLNQLSFKSTSDGTNPISNTGFLIIPGDDPKTSDLLWGLNVNNFYGKNYFESFAWFNNNVGIGESPEPTTSVNVATSNARLKVVRVSQLTSNPLTTASSSQLIMSGSLGSGNCDVYSANYAAITWTPNANFDFSTYGLTNATFSGSANYLRISSKVDTTNSNMSSSSAQVYTSAESAVFFSNVSSATAGGVTTITLSGSQNTSGINIGDQIIIVAGTGNFGAVNVYVKTIPTSATFTVGKISGTYPSYTTINFAPTTQLSGANIRVARANSGNKLGSIDNAIGSRILGISADRTIGSSVEIDKVVGLQIDDQLTIPNPSNPNGWINTDITAGRVNNSYAIRQVGSLDKNFFAGPIIIPKTLSATAGDYSMGTAQLTAGSVVITTTASRSGSLVFVSRMYPSGTVGHLYVRDTDITNGSFTINSTSGTDTSFVNWWVIANTEY